MDDCVFFVCERECKTCDFSLNFFVEEETIEIFRTSLDWKTVNNPSLTLSFKRQINEYETSLWRLSTSFAVIPRGVQMPAHLLSLEQLLLLLGLKWFYKLNSFLLESANLSKKTKTPKISSNSNYSFKNSITVTNIIIFSCRQKKTRKYFVCF